MLLRAITCAQVRGREVEKILGRPSLRIILKSEHPCNNLIESEGNGTLKSSTSKFKSNKKLPVGVLSGAVARPKQGGCSVQECKAVVSVPCLPGLGRAASIPPGSAMALCLVGKQLGWVRLGVCERQGHPSTPLVSSRSMPESPQQSHLPSGKAFEVSRKWLSQAAPSGENSLTAVP